jgi:hydroxyacylglutathione hydrolase
VHIQGVVGGPHASIGYLVFEREGGEALVIDTPMGSTARYLAEVERHKLTVLYVVNSHGHWDLIADNLPLTQALGAELLAHAWDSTRLSNPSMGVERIDEKVPPVPPSRPDRYLHDGEHVVVGGLDFEVLHTPGHTPGSLCLYESGNHTLFTGDLLGKNMVGNTSFPGGNPELLRQSLLRLATLPNETRVYPSHGLPTTIRDARWLLDLAKVS